MIKLEPIIFGVILILIWATLTIKLLKPAVDGFERYVRKAKKLAESSRRRMRRRLG